MIFVRPEAPGDGAAIASVTARAFATNPHAGGHESLLIDKLRAAGALALSLVADMRGIIVGQVSFSRAAADDGAQGWFTLGPVSVDPAMHRMGIGAMLIETGLDQLRAQDAAGVIVVGNPDYYRRFGFALRPDLAPDARWAGHFLVLPMRIAEPVAIVHVHPLFDEANADAR